MRFKALVQIHISCLLVLFGETLQNINLSVLNLVYYQTTMPWFS